MAIEVTFEEVVTGFTAHKNTLKNEYDVRITSLEVIKDKSGEKPDGKTPSKTISKRIKSDDMLKTVRLESGDDIAVSQILEAMTKLKTIL